MSLQFTFTRNFRIFLQQLCNYTACFNRGCSIFLYVCYCALLLCAELKACNSSSYNCPLYSSYLRAMWLKLAFYIMILQNADNLTQNQTHNFISNFTVDVSMFPFLLKHVALIFSLSSSTNSGFGKRHCPFEKSLLKQCKTLLSTYLLQTTRNTSQHL
jgi:hypothetical protein